MTESNNTGRISRRNVLRGIGGAGLVGGGMVAGMSLSSSPVAALHTEDALELEGTSVETTRGEIAYLAAGFQGFVQWMNQPEPITHLFNRTQFNWDTDDSQGADQWRTLSEGTRDVENTADRDWDTSESGRDGHFTNHIPNPDGSLIAFVEDDDSDELRDSDTFHHDGHSLDPETEDNTWIIARDDDALDRLDEEDLPYAVNPEYGLPPDPLDSGQIPVPDGGGTHELTVGYHKEIRILNGDDPDDDVVDQDEVETTFNLEISHLEGQLVVTQRGLTAADGA